MQASKRGAPGATPFVRNVSKHVKEGDWFAIGEVCRECLEEGDELAEAHYLLALSDFMADDHAGAIRHASRAFDLRNDVAEFADLLALLHALVSDVKASTYYRKLAMALPSDKTVKGWGMPQGMPDYSKAFLSVVEDPLFVRGSLALRSGDFAKAESWYSQAVQIDPTHLNAHLALANTQIIQGHFRAASDALRSARHVLADNGMIASLLGSTLTALGQFAEARAVHEWARRVARDDPVVHASAVTDLMADENASVDELTGAFRRWGEAFGVREGVAAPGSAEARDRLTVGYVVGHGAGTATASALADILAAHDAARFRVIGFGFGDLSDVPNMPFQKAFDTWHDIGDVDPVTLGAVVATEQVDILVDAMGFSSPSHLTAFGARMAPVQISWMGAPLGTGLAGMDFLITDRFLDPAEGSSAGFRERLHSLEGGCPVVGIAREDAGASAREEPVGEAATFVADATLGELTPRVAACWARILHQVPGSVLALRDHDFRNQENLGRLIDLFGDFGVSDRIDVIAASEGRGLWRHGGLCLVPFGYSRPQEVLDALAAGRPAICLVEDARHRRFTASMLHHLTLGDETLVADEDAYVAKAVAWASDDAARASFGETVVERMTASPLMDARKRAGALEAFFEEAWRDVASAVA
jgi:predicted O-linked N-acetylglucosamine transferase (SPINDLY family)